ncbi:MAG: Peptidase U32 [Parcubacteria group bacterium GW2011_GWC2_39_14]|nr:MAG: Peptidase U32 [Parcubacteria group bacterium GW2011_GWC2_39_14]KKR55049.1 MAG: Peptidase U32 [Parcubacteria group bacterium GW2011_GWA2_40_23]
MPQFSLATNFDTKILSEIDKLNKKYPESKVFEVYGSLPLSLTGSGRSTIGLPAVSTTDLAKHIETAHKFSLKFNYLMNSSRVSDLDDLTFRKQLDMFLNDLIKIQVDSITLADEKLIRYVRRKFPTLPIHVSLITGVDTVAEAKKYSNLGVSLTTLNQHTINRDLKTIATIVQDVNCDIMLYANISCLQNCPLRDAHYKWLSSQSNESTTDDNQRVDKFILQCERQYIENPIEFLRSPFIRPEALKLYEAVGVKHFKLSDRRESTEALVKTAEAYMSGAFHGNLFSFLFRDDRKWSNAVRNIVEVKSLGNTAININNDKLTAFNFDELVTLLTGEDLEKFYVDMTTAAVSGVDDQKTKSFHNKLQSVL